VNRGVFAHWPNRITALRFVGALALFWLLATLVPQEGRGDVAGPELATAKPELQAAFWLFLAVALSDILDGWLARRGNLITAFGRIADPFVDKVLVLGTMIFLAVLPWSRAYFPAWIVVVILAREFLVTGIRGYVESAGREFPADWFGKVKMALQCTAVGIVMGVAAFELPEALERLLEGLAKFCVVATVVTSVGSGISYIFKARKLLSGDAR
jgi:CDP-diacylglycerol--glycerol-3-phosphate 3-phosphatidyltransferase